MIRKIKSRVRIAIMALGAVTLLLAASPAFSQSCALCYTQAAAAGTRMIEALRSGILILIIPPTLGSVGMIFLLHHKSNQFRDTNPDAEADHPEIEPGSPDSAEG